MTTPAVVCGTNSVTSEPSTPSRAARTRSVTSSNCVLRSVAMVSSRTRSFSREHIRESDELQRPELFGAHVRIAPDVGQGCFRLRAAGEARKLDRIGEPLPPVREGSRDDPLHAREILGVSLAAKGDERRVHVRARPEDRPRHGMEAGSLGGELDEHRDRAVGLRRRLGEEAVGDLTLDHHAPKLQAGEAVEALDDERSRDVVRQVRDELRWRRLEAPEVEAERVGDLELDVRPVSEPLRERVRKRAVELDRVHARDAVGEIGGQDPEPRTDLEHDVLRRELREAADHAEDVLVDEEVLPELLLGEREPHESENAAAAFASSRAASSAGSSPRASASAATVWTTFAGSFGRPRRSWGLRYGLSVSARRRSGGTRRAGSRSSSAFGYVTLPANETEEPPPRGA